MTETAPARELRLGEQQVAKPEPGDERFWSVTTLINCLDKPALLFWAAEETAKTAVAVARSLPSRVEEEGEDAVVKWLRDARFRPPKGRRSATELGTLVHDACQELALTGSWPEVDDEVRPFVTQADRLLQHLQPTFVAAEAAVYSMAYGYAGTLDALVEVSWDVLGSAGEPISGDGDKARLIVDWKTSRKDHDSQGKVSAPYPEHALQLAAYRRADLLATWRARRFEHFRRRYYALSADERDLGVPMPAVDGGLILHLTPGHGHAHPVRCDEAVFESFLYCMELTRWQLEIAPHVIGAPLEFPKRGDRP